MDAKKVAGGALLLAVGAAFLAAAFVGWFFAGGADQDDALIAFGLPALVLLGAGYAVLAGALGGSD